MQSFSSSSVQKEFKALRQAAAHAPVSITANGKPTFVMMSYAEYRRLTSKDAPPEFVEIPHLSERHPDAKPQEI